MALKYECPTPGPEYDPRLKKIIIQKYKILSLSFQGMLSNWTLIKLIGIIEFECRISIPNQSWVCFFVCLFVRKQLFLQVLIKKKSQSRVNLGFDSNITMSSHRPTPKPEMPSLFFYSKWNVLDDGISIPELYTVPQKTCNVPQELNDLNWNLQIYPWISVPITCHCT